jgi:hypothetical protein
LQLLSAIITLLVIWTREEVCKLAQNPFVIRQPLDTFDTGNSHILYRFDVVFGQICRDTGAKYKALIWRAFHSTPSVWVRDGDDLFKDDLIGLASTVHISC